LADLIPKAQQWFDNNLNVMLVGLHGVGKTRAVLDLCRKNSVRLKYYSCSTLDPYTDLVGVPVPVTDDDGTQRLQMVRPREVDEAEMIFFDEFNRADPKVHNALMEILLFKTINGEPLPNLKSVWAAMNPPGQDYNVEDLDPALIDRFDVFEDVTARPSAEYLQSRGIREHIAKVLHAWWTEQSRTRRDVSEQITPRRLEKIGLVYESTGDTKAAIPNWFQQVDRQKLRHMIEDAENKLKGKQAGSSGKAPNSSFRYDPEYMAENNAKVAEYLSKNPSDHETHKAVLEAIKNRQGHSLIRDHGDILDALIPAYVEGYLTNMNPGKFQSMLKQIRDDSPGWKKGQLANIAKLVEAEAVVRGS
jgi:MoxR-like ATPase